MLINVGQALSFQTSERILILRYPDGFEQDINDEGIIEDLDRLQIKALASVQAPDPEEIKLLSELERTKEWRLFYVNRNIRTSDQYEETEADILVYGNKQYRAMKNYDWDSYGYSVVMGARIDDRRSQNQ